MFIFYHLHPVFTIYR